MCSKVDLKHTNLYRAKIIKFKNKKQMEEANLDTSNFAGSIIFAEENGQHTDWQTMLGRLFDNNLFSIKALSAVNLFKTFTL